MRSSLLGNLGLLQVVLSLEAEFLSPPRLVDSEALIDVLGEKLFFDGDSNVACSCDE